MRHEQEIIDKAVEALRQRLGEDALRYLAKREGHGGGEDFSKAIIYGIDVREFTRLTKRPECRGVCDCADRRIRTPRAALVCRCPSAAAGRSAGRFT
jgi:hypothetical protein